MFFLFSHEKKPSVLFFVYLAPNLLIMKKIFAILFIIIAVNCYAEIPTGYYDNATGLQGEELKTALHNIIKNHTVYPYTDSGTDVWDILKESDRDPNNPDNVILIYTGNSVNAAQEYNSGNGWSREHVWAKSHGFPSESDVPYTDTHHLRPVYQPANSSRGTKDFDNGGTPVSSAPECNATSTTWEPRDAVKGDIARMMFYMATRYEGENGEPDLELVDYTGTSTDTPLFGKLSTLIQWNQEDPVDNFERNRNEVVYSYQHNRNPFIDHPEYVNAIYISINTAPLIEDQSFTIAENSATGTEIGTIVASDPEGDDLSFSILSGNTDNAFTVINTGLLTVNNSAALDYEITTSFSLNVEVSDGSLASNATITINLDKANGLLPLSSNTEIRAYPNPVSDILYLNIPENYSVEVYSIIGEKLISCQKKQLDFHGFDAGIYFVIIKNEFYDTVQIEKIIKK